MSEPAENAIRDEVDAAGGGLTLASADLYRRFGVSGHSEIERQSIATLLESVGLETAGAATTADGREGVRLRTHSRELVERAAGVRPQREAAPVAPAAPVQAPIIVQQPVLVASEKSVGVALLLAFFFGPLGMLYATVPGGLIMLFISLFAVPFTIGLALIVIIPICMLWAGLAASDHNSKIRRQPMIAAAPAGPAPGWYGDPSGGAGRRYWNGRSWTDHFAPE